MKFYRKNLPSNPFPARISGVCDPLKRTSWGKWRTPLVSFNVTWVQFHEFHEIRCGVSNPSRSSSSSSRTCNMLVKAFLSVKDMPWKYSVTASYSAKRWRNGHGLVRISILLPHGVISRVSRVAPWRYSLPIIVFWKLEAPNALIK